MDRRYAIDHEPTPEDVAHLLRSSGVTNREAATLVHVSLLTVRSWVRYEGSASNRQMPLAAWELLLLKLGAHPTHTLKERG